MALENLSNLFLQMAPKAGEIGSRLGASAEPLQKVPALPTSSPQAPTNQLPYEPPEISFQNPDQDPKRLKGFAKAISTFSDIIQEPAVRKMLGAVGIGLDPRGVGGQLGQLGVALAEENARQGFRQSLEEGASPAEAAAANRGISSEGRLAEEQAFNLLGQQALDQQNKERQLAQGDRRLDQEDAALGLRASSLDLDKDKLALAEEAEANRLALGETRNRIDQQLADIRESRSKYENLRDAAYARRVDAGLEDGEDSNFRDVNRVRDQLLDQLAEQQEELQATLSAATRELTAIDNGRSKFFRRGLTVNAVRKLFGAGERDLTPEEKEYLQDRAAVIAARNAAQNALELNRLYQDELINETQNDVRGRSDYTPANVDRNRRAGGSQTTPNIPRVTLQEAANLPEGTVFQAPDGKFYSRTPNGAVPVTSVGGQ